MIIKGVVDRISSKRIGRGSAYSFCVDGEWYRHGFDAPKFKEGYLVQFDDTPINQYNTIDISTVKFKKGEPQVHQGGGSKGNYQKKNSGGGSSENWEARAAYWDKKDEQDIVKNKQYNYRSAFYLAKDMIDKGLELEALKLGAKNATGPKKWDAYLEMIEAMADDLHHKFMNAGEVAKAQEPEPVNDDIQDDSEARSTVTGDEWESSNTPSEEDDWDD